MGGDESDDESPEVVSSSTMKSKRDIWEKELRDISLQKQKARDELKLKRKLKAEQLLGQKKEKKAKVQADEDPKNKKEQAPTQSASGILPIKISRDPSETLEGAEDHPVQEGDGVGVTEDRKESPVHRKIYPKFNVVVEPLTKLKNPRAAAALSFKEKRLAKVPRENVASTLSSYREKLLVKNT